MNTISAAAKEAAELSLELRGNFCSASTAWVLITSRWFNTHDPRFKELAYAMPDEFQREYNRYAEAPQQLETLQHA
jgi:hypothetical protein